MPNDARDLLRAIERLVRAEDTLSRTFEQELSRVSRRMLVEVGALLGSDEWTDSQKIRAGQLARLLADIRKSLAAAGYDRLAADLEPLDALAARARRLALSRRAAALSAGARRRIAAAKALFELDILKQGDAAARAIWRAAANAVIGGQPADGLLQDLRAVLDREMRYVATLFDTQVTVFSRQAGAISSRGTTDERFAFLGPVDGLTRRWCMDRVGRVYSRAEIDDMDNGQLPNPWLTGGGYNCRHRWVLLSSDSPWRPLAGTANRIPEVEADIRDL